MYLQCKWYLYMNLYLYLYLYLHLNFWRSDLHLQILLCHLAPPASVDLLPCYHRSFFVTLPLCLPCLYLLVFACICLYLQLRSTVIQHLLVQIVSLMAWELESNLFLFGPRKKFPQLGFGVRPIISTRPYNHQDQKLFLAHFLIFLHISLFFHSSCTSSILIDHTQSPWKIHPPAPSFCLPFSFLFFTQNTCQAWLSNTCQLCPWFS